MTKVREDEMNELDDATHDYCELPVKGGAENVHGKVNILMQSYISRGRMRVSVFEFDGLSLICFHLIFQFSFNQFV